MKKSTLSRALFVAGVVAMAGVAQAQTFDSPTQAGEASTMTEGQPNAVTTNSPYSDGSHTMILGAGPAVVTTDSYVTTYSYPSYSHPLPAPVATYGWGYGHGGASETSNVPERAGEASTMTGGVPNAATMN